MKGEKEFSQIFLCAKPVDFRKGIFSLSAYVQSEMKEAPFSGALFLFTNKNRRNLKALYWDRNGFALWLKALEEGKFPWPKKNTEDKLSLTSEEFSWLLRGIDFLKIKPHKELKYSTVI